MLSRRAKYALKAMICLAQSQDPAPLSVSDVARRTNVPQPFLEQILSELKRRNLLVSRRGKQGGFQLARKPEEITFAEIIRHIDGPLALAPCASRTAYRPCPECRDAKTCELRRTLILVRDATADILENTTLASELTKQPAPKRRLKHTARRRI